MRCVKNVARPQKFIRFWGRVFCEKYGKDGKNGRIKTKYLIKFNRDLQFECKICNFA